MRDIIKNKLIFRSAVLSILLIIHLVYILIFTKEFAHVLDTGLPFREAYHPTLSGILFIYLLPLIEGWLAGSIFTNSRVKTPVYYINLALLMSVFIAIASSLAQIDISKYWFAVNSLAYYHLIYPFIALLGMLPRMLGSNVKIDTLPEFAKKSNMNRGKNFTKKDILAVSSIAVVIFALNLIPALKSDYLVGADVYYHAPKSADILRGESLTENPFFENDHNYYYSIVYYIVAGFSALTKQPVETIWFYYVPVCAAIFSILFYVFTRMLTGNSTVALIATSFVMILNQVLWIDPSVRALSYVFFSAFLLSFVTYLQTNSKKHLILSGIFWLLTAASHPEIAIHLVLITIVYSVFSAIYTKKWYQKLFTKVQERPPLDAIYLHTLSARRNLCILLLLHLLIFFFYISYSLQRYSIQQILIFNEIPLSIFQPIGIASFLVFMLAIPLIPKMLSELNNRSNRLVMSIAALSGTGLFYFSYLWVLYHRYFFETAFFALAILAAHFITQYFNAARKNIKLYMLALVAAFIIISVAPRMTFILSYASGTNASMHTRQADFDMVKNNSSSGDVILIHPDDMLNRYLPTYAERKIVAGSSVINKEKQWQVLSFCNGPYRASCDARDNTSREFYDSPDPRTYESLQSKYPFDYVLVSRQNPEKTERFMLSTSVKLKEVAENERYIMYAAPQPQEMKDE